MISNQRVDDMVKLVEVLYIIHQALLNGGMDSEVAEDHPIQEATRAWA